MSASVPPTRRTRPRARRARSALLSAVAALLCLNAGLIVAMETVTRLRDPFYGDKARTLLRRLEPVAGVRPPLVLMLGSSRSGMGFDGQRMEAAVRDSTGVSCVAFNFGVPSAGPVTGLLYLRRLLADGVRPDLLFIEVLPVTLDERPDPFEFKGFTALRLLRSELGGATDYGFDEDQVGRDWWQATLFPPYGLRHLILDRILPKFLPPMKRLNWSRSTDASGWNSCPFDPPTTDQIRKQTEHSRTVYAPTLRLFKVGGPAERAFRELLALCRDEGIPTRAVLMPEGTEFRSWYAPATEVELMRYLTATCAEFDATLIDARTWVPDEEFLDSHHLLKAGARRFTDRLTSDWVLPWHRGRNPEVRHGR